MTRTYAIGDIHGRADLLEQAVRWLAAQPAGQLVILGDFVDRGPDSRRVIEMLMGLPGALPGWTVVVLQGNHEAMMLLALTAPTAELVQWWFRNGGAQTMLSYDGAALDDFQPHRVPSRVRQWLSALPLAFEDDHRIYVHAGVSPDVAMPDQRTEVLQWLLWSDERPHQSGKHVVHGHHQSATNPLSLPHRTNLDAFAWFTGKLAIGVFDGPGGLQNTVWIEGAAA